MSNKSCSKQTVLAVFLFLATSLVQINYFLANKALSFSVYHSNTFLHHSKEAIIGPRTSHRLLFRSVIWKTEPHLELCKGFTQNLYSESLSNCSQVKKHKYTFLSGKSSLNSNSDTRLVTTAVHKLYTKHGHFEFENSRPQGD